MKLDDIYTSFLTSLNRIDKNGKIVGRLGGDVPILPDREKCVELRENLSQSLQKWNWIIYCEIVVVFVLIIVGILIMVLTDNKSLELVAFGLDFGIILSMLKHIHGIWKDTVETEIAINIVSNLPVEHVLSYMELRYERRTKK